MEARLELVYEVMGGENEDLDFILLGFYCGKSGNITPILRAVEQLEPHVDFFGEREYRLVVDQAKFNFERQVPKAEERFVSNAELYASVARQLDRYSSDLNLCVKLVVRLAHKGVSLVGKLNPIEQPENKETVARAISEQFKKAAVYYQREFVAICNKRLKGLKRVHEVACHYEKDVAREGERYSWYNALAVRIRFTEMVLGGFLEYKGALHGGKRANPAYERFVGEPERHNQVGLCCEVAKQTRWPSKLHAMSFFCCILDHEKAAHDKEASIGRLLPGVSQLSRYGGHRREVAQRAEILKEVKRIAKTSSR